MHGRYVWVVRSCTNTVRVSASPSKAARIKKEMERDLALSGAQDTRVYIERVLLEDYGP